MVGLEPFARHVRRVLGGDALAVDDHQQQIDALAVLRVDIKEARATLVRIEKTT